MLKRAIDTLIALALVCAAGYVAWERWLWITSWGYPVDYSGFYYLQEIRHRIESGQGYYEKFSSFFFLLSAFAELFLVGPQRAFELSVWASFMLFALGAAMLAYSGKLRAPSALILFLVLNTETLFAAHYAYPRQASGMALLAWGLWGIKSADGVSPSAVRRLFALAAILLASSFHVFAAVLVLVLIFPWGLSLKGQKSIFTYAWLAVILILALHLSIRSKAVINNLAWSSRLVWYWARDLSWIGRYEFFDYQMFAAAAVLLIAAAVWRRDRDRVHWAAWAVLLVLIAPIWKQEFIGYAFRLMRCSSWIFFVELAFSLAAADRVQRQVSLLVLTVLFVTTVSLHSAYEEIPRAIGPGISIAPLAEHEAVLREWLDPDAFILASHGTQFSATYFLRRSSAKALPRDRPKSLYGLNWYPPPGRLCTLLFGGEPIHRGESCVQISPQLFLYRMD